jgi:DNA-binding MarR family transcriptional regulator
MLDRFGLNPTQYSLLATLQPGDGQRLTRLSQRLLLSKSTITRVVDQLEQAGIVRRLGDAADRRAQRVVLTEEGLRIQRKITAGHDLSLRRRLSVLTAAERKELDALLAKLREGLKSDLGRDGDGAL